MAEQSSGKILAKLSSVDLNHATQNGQRCRHALWETHELIEDEMAVDGRVDARSGHCDHPPVTHTAQSQISAPKDQTATTAVTTKATIPDRTAFDRTAFVVDIGIPPWTAAVGACKQRNLTPTRLPSTTGGAADIRIPYFG
jgi:hypothetical protein